MHDLYEAAVIFGVDGESRRAVVNMNHTCAISEDGYLELANRWCSFGVNRRLLTSLNPLHALSFGLRHEMRE